MAGDDQSSYAGRWVARLRGRIVAQGGTPDQARHAAQSRYKETTEIVFMATNSPLTFPPILDKVLQALPEGTTIFLVGGAVRDALLNRTIHDLDFILEKDAIKSARRVANTIKADFYPLDPERDTGRVILTADDGSRILMDFAAYRGPDLEADILGRDFTLNAIAYDLQDKTIHDPLGGAMDLKEKRLRACSPSAFKDDPVRILRGVRLAANFGFHIMLDTRREMKDAANLVGLISPERLRDELFRLLDGLQPATCLRALDLLGALNKIFPELTSLKGVVQPQPHVHDVWEHSLAVVSHLETIFAALSPSYNPDTASDLLSGLLVLRLGRFRRQIAETFTSPLSSDRSVRSLLFLAALLHDVAKPLAKKVDDEGKIRFWDHDQQGAEIVASKGRSLVLSNDEIQRLEKVVRNHMRLLHHINRLAGEGKPPSRRAIYRFFRDAGPAGVDICLLALADLRATYEQTLPQETWAAALEVVRSMLENWFEKPAESINPPPLLNGDDLMQALDLPPGKMIGDLIETLREAQAMGKITTREQALQMAREKMAEIFK
jgi:poly(A) polymerase